MRLTEAVILNAQPRAKPFKLTDGAGLYLEVSPSGGKHWRLKYRFGGKENRLSLGGFPQVSILEARARRDHWRALLAEGINPSAQAKLERGAPPAEESRPTEGVRFYVDNEGALSVHIGRRWVAFSPTETDELRTFLVATRAVGTRGHHGVD